jgi:DNA-binding transcriptional LysR family regulator
MATTSALLSTCYRYFATVAELGSVRAASRALNVSASAISRQIQILETELGCDLFERRGRALKLSLAGEIAMRSYRTVEREQEEMLTELERLRGLERGRVRLATVESVSNAFVPDLLRQFADRYPGIEVAVTVTTADGVVDLILMGEAEIGLTFNASPSRGLSVSFDHAIPLGVVMPRDHALAGRRKLTIRECIAFPLAWPSAGLSLRTILDAALAAERAHVRPAYVCNTLALMASLARAGRCITFLTRIGIERDLAEGHLHFVPLAETHLPADRLMLVRLAGISGRPAADAFHDAAQSALERWVRGRAMR